MIGMIAAELAVDIFNSFLGSWTPSDAMDVLICGIKTTEKDCRLNRPLPGAVTSFLLGEKGREQGRGESYRERLFFAAQEDPYLTQGELCCGAVTLARELLASDVSDTVCRMTMEGFARQFPPHVEPSVVLGLGAAASWLDLEGWWNIDEVREGLQAFFPPEYAEDINKNIDGISKARSWTEAVSKAMELAHLDPTWPSVIGGLAEITFGVPREVQDRARRSLDPARLQRLDAFEDDLRRARTASDLRTARCRSELDSPVLYCETGRHPFEVSDEWDYAHVQSLPFGREMLDRAEFAHTWSPDLTKVYDIPPMSRDVRLLSENEGYAATVDWSRSEVILYQKMSLQMTEDLIRARGGVQDPDTDLSHDLRRALAGADLSPIDAEDLLASQRLEPQRLCLWASAPALSSALASQGVAVSFPDWREALSQRRDEARSEVERQNQKTRRTRAPHRPQEESQQYRRRR